MPSLALVSMDPSPFIHFPSPPTPIPLVVEHRRWREVLEAGEASEEVWDGAGEVAVVEGHHLQLLHGVGERKWERQPSAAIAGGIEARVVAE